ncbi:DUF6270 domain-containing protein [Corynebacterium sp. MSK105]|uniref:DUF6270 domain-containing protein n=1 Tax=unclassified Corynebacterium TaxID=2624378 RepID=UPI00254EE83A|nr:MULTISPECIES: DUF6270 domain-containing protein [unclassified Corynebacterium]MDK8482250.1 DUF6270 domain-containing protein [Corynebacterium sp. MSK074]MDK8689889.1 DUF6270 domain-containing protein [Corynebacterium sp. MSK105]
MSFEDQTGQSFSAESVKTFIFGGCVSRDTIAFARPNAFSLQRYVARQSLLSVGRSAQQDIERIDLASPFQKRMLEGDIIGNLLAELGKYSDMELLIWDLIVERNGVWEFPSGGIVTNSAELTRNSGGKQSVKRARKIDFGTEEHFLRWQGAVSLFAAYLKQVNLTEKVVVLAPEWAEHFPDGRSFSRRRSKDIERKNEIFSRYYSELRRMKFPVIGVSHTVADPDHRWGAAPFHFTSSAYKTMESRLLDKVKEIRR